MQHYKATNAQLKTTQHETKQRTTKHNNAKHIATHNNIKHHKMHTTRKPQTTKHSKVKAQQNKSSEYKIT